MTKAVQISSTGGPEVMSMVDIPLAKPGAGEALVRHHAVGLNCIDVYFRNGVYPAEALPTVLGMEGAGVVEAVGKGVEHVKPGDRVAYAGRPMGAYCEARVLLTALLVHLPKAILRLIKPIRFLRSFRPTPTLRPERPQAAAF